MSKKVVMKRKKVHYDFLSPIDRKKQNVKRYVESVETTETVEKDLIDDSSSSADSKKDIKMYPIGEQSTSKQKWFDNLNIQKISTIIGTCVGIFGLIGYFIYLHVQTSVNSTNISNIKDNIKEIKEDYKKHDSLIIELIKAIKK